MTIYICMFILTHIYMYIYSYIFVYIIYRIFIHIHIYTYILIYPYYEYISKQYWRKYSIKTSIHGSYIYRCNLYKTSIKSPTTDGYINALQLLQSGCFKSIRTYFKVIKFMKIDASEECWKGNKQGVTGI